MEKVDLYFNERIKSGQQIERGESYDKSLNILTVHACLFNQKGEMLIQQRASNKRSRPNMWDITVGGCVQSDENPNEAIHRELKEELGIEYDFSHSRPFITVNYEKGFDDFFLIETNFDIKNVRFTDNEVQNVKWATCEEIVDMIDSEKFIPYYTSFIKSLFELRNAINIFK